MLHLNGTPKGLSDVARLLHRDDLANLQYGLKKLLSLGFIDKASNGASRRNTTYVPTESGRAIVDAYLQHRRDTLVRLVGSMSGTQDSAAAGDLDFACDDRALRSGQHDPVEPDRRRPGPPAVRDKSQLQSMNSSYELPLD